VPGADPLALAELRARRAGAVLAVPVRAEGRTIGALELYAATPRPWSRHDVQRTRLLVHQLRGALTRLGRRPAAPAAA
jgi:GAF domain-containing protein